MSCKISSNKPVILISTVLQKTLLTFYCQKFSYPLPPQLIFFLNHSKQETKKSLLHAVVYSQSGDSAQCLNQAVQKRI